MATKQTFTSGQVLTAAQMNTLQDYVGVVQVQSTTKSDSFSTNSASYVALTGLSVSITPTSASNKILVFASIESSGNFSVTSALFQCLRGATAIGIGNAAGSRGRVSLAGGNQATSMESGSFIFLDSPATTSATTYSFQVLSTFGTAQTIYVNRTENDGDFAYRPRGISTITVMEVTP
jgi:hypothetical protein